MHELERYMRCCDCSEVEDTPISDATLWRCGQLRSLQAIRHRRGGQARDDYCEQSTIPI
jgi:hypothetical protein